MATIELNERAHQLIDSMHDLRSKLIDDNGDGAHSHNLFELERGLDDAAFLALVSDYLTGLRRQHSQLRMEHRLLRDELEYVRGQLVAALEHTVASEEAAARRVADERSAGFAQPDPLDAELSFDETSIFGSDSEDQGDDGIAPNQTGGDRSPPQRLYDNDDDDDNPDELILIIEDGTATPAEYNSADSPSMLPTTPPPPPPSSPRIVANSETVHQPLRTRLLSQHFAAYLNAGDYDVAAPVCHRMLSDLSSSGSGSAGGSSSSGRRDGATPDSAYDLAAALEVLALADRSHGRFSDAAAHQRAALDIYERCVPAGHAAHIAALNTLAHLYGRCGQPERARPLCALALQLRRAACGPRDRSVGRQHYNAAVVEQQCGALEAALQHYRCALDIYAATHTVLVAADARAACDSDGDGQKVAQMTDTIRQRMAGILVQLGRLPEAAGVCKEWLAPTTRQRVPPQQQQGRHSLGGTGSGVKTMRPIWEVAEEIERMCSTTGAGRRRRQLESYELRCDYRQWYDSVRVHFPGACAALKRLAFVYRRMNMHYAAKMLEHCCTLQGRKRTLRFDESCSAKIAGAERFGGANKENEVPNSSFKA